MSSYRGISQLEKIIETGWRSGLANLMGVAFGSWWRTREWLIQALIWTAVINGSLAAVIWGPTPEDVSVFSLYGVMTMFAAIAVIIIMQEAIVGEKKNGTAAWVLSKPVSRTAFVLSKLVPNAVGVFATMIVIPSSLLYIQFLISGLHVSMGLFALGALIATLNLMFYLTLTLMLGAHFDSGGPVIGISLAFAFGQQLISGIPILKSLLPWSLLVPVGDSDTSVIGAVITGQPLESISALVFTGTACLLFSVIAFWKFSHTEL
jgi:ABC-2 type transport system permease protein